MCMVTEAAGLIRSLSRADRLRMGSVGLAIANRHYMIQRHSAETRQTPFGDAKVGKADVARWGRAEQLLGLPQRARVLDLGCAFGFGTKLLARRYQTFGHDLSASYIERARRNVPDATFTLGPADAVPYPDASFDGVVLLDVMEHVPDDRAVVDEIARLLRPGGRLVLSVPNRGLMARLDSLNVYERLARPGWLPPTDDPSWDTVREHRHYSLDQIRRLFDNRFHIRDARWSGIGIAEPVNLALLLALRGIARLPRVYDIAQYLYFGVYLLEDLVPLPRLGYHLMIVADRVTPPTGAGNPG